MIRSRSVAATLTGIVALSCHWRSPLPVSTAEREAAAAVAARQLTTTPSGQHVLALIEAVNSRDSATILRFGSEHYDPRALAESGGEERLLNRWLELGYGVGRVALDSVAAISPLETTVWLRGTVSRAWVIVRSFADSAPPHRLIRVGLGRGLRPPWADAGDSGVGVAELPARIAAYLDAMVAADLFSGAVVIAHQGQPIFARAYGAADRAVGRPFRLDTPLDVASVGKLFTTVAVAQLFEQGILSLDDTLARWVPELPAAIGRRVTVRHLLEHSSGLGELGPKLDSAMRRARTTSEMVRLLTDTALAFAPGTDVQYSNRGYVVLGMVVERASGRPYGEYVHDAVFKRAGMIRTAVPVPERLPDDRARRYSRYLTLRSPFTPGPRIEFDPLNDLAPGPHGGVYSTAEDLLRFARALGNGTLLRAETLERLTTARPAGFGTGFEAGGEGRAVFYGHQGGAPGANTFFRVFPQKGYVVIVLSNTDNGASLAGPYISGLLP